MTYLKIASKSTTTANDMFTLGVSTARGTGKIGQFGSGSMMGVLLWLRSFGESPIFMINGEKVTFEATPELNSEGGVYNSVTMKQGRKKTRLSVCLEYGEMDWKDPYMSLREWVSNALDQGANIHDCVKTVTNTKAEPNEVAVLIPMNATVKLFLQNLPQYFLQFTGQQDTMEIQKREPSPCRVYRRGVFLQELKQTSICDYNMDFPVDESRNGSVPGIQAYIRDFIHGERQQTPSVELMKATLEAVVRGTRMIESSLSSPWDSLRQCWTQIIGDNKYSKVDTDGAITVPESWYEMIIRFKPEADGMKLLSEADMQGYVKYPPSDSTMQIVRRLWSVLDAIGLTNGKELPQIEMFKTKDGQLPSAFGMYRNGTVSIWEDHASSKQTILEELCHHASGARDRSTQFQEYLLRGLTELSDLL